ncbi:hypothetical protein A2125_01490 [Candidatus Woesebacteria bacterium GWB1_43_5]|uniref:Uncharacterized protein n=1 Tax=Candidatus Woesebacteria bacterium GWB1_43_5 TaxID=1802474 RepID=A0A1F7WVE5_9BACT|nr:MAG: hypothetical protein A2125_01490 [Candidatus Woesebacteria bacterium GWB1_43_5]
MATKQAKHGQPAIYNSTAPTLSDGDASALNVDSSGNQKITLATTIAGEDIANDVTKVEQRFSYLNITLAAPTTTVVKSGAGFFHALTINTPAATGVITMYDNTAGSGTLIGAITQPAALLQNSNTVIYDVSFAVGLTIVTATAAQDLTVSYR